MIKYFKTKYEIHDQQVFAVGTSGGGHMCYPGDIDVHVEAWQFFKRQLEKD